MIAILDRRQHVKSWLSAAPLKDLDIFDVASSAIDIRTITEMNLLVVTDYDEGNFRVFKDRHTGEDFILPIEQLGEFVTNWMTEDNAWMVISEMEQDNG